MENIYHIFTIIGQRPAGKDEFSDILGAHGFKPSSETQKETLRQLKKVEVSEETDPIKRKVSDILFSLLIHLNCVFLVSF